MSKPVLWLIGLIIGVINLIVGGAGGETSRLLAVAGSLGSLFLRPAFRLSRFLGVTLALLVAVAAIFTAASGHRATFFVLVSIGVNLVLGFILTH